MAAIPPALAGRIPPRWASGKMIVLLISVVLQALAEEPRPNAALTHDLHVVSGLPRGRSLLRRVGAPLRCDSAARVIICMTECSMGLCKSSNEMHAGVFGTRIHVSEADAGYGGERCWIPSHDPKQLGRASRSRADRPPASTRHRVGRCRRRVPWYGNRCAETRPGPAARAPAQHSIGASDCEKQNTAKG